MEPDFVHGFLIGLGTATGCMVVALLIGFVFDRDDEDAPCKHVWDGPIKLVGYAEVATCGLCGLPAGFEAGDPG